MGNPVSEEAHQYRAPKSDAPVALKAFPEGEYFETLMEGKGRYHSGGEITFAVSVNPENKGVRLRRRIDQKSPCQKADVYVDGEYAGCWYLGCVNEHLRWFDSDFDIHPFYTKGKKSLQIKLDIKAGEGLGAFTDFAYWAYSFLLP